MIAMTGMCMHCACRPGVGMFARSVWLLMQMLMGVSVIHVVLAFAAVNPDFFGATAAARCLRT
jgi:hypothetical protein